MSSHIYRLPENVVKVVKILWSSSVTAHILRARCYAPAHIHKSLLLTQNTLNCLFGGYPFKCLRGQCVYTDGAITGLRIQHIASSTVLHYLDAWFCACYAHTTGDYVYDHTSDNYLNTSSTSTLWNWLLKHGSVDLTSYTHFVESNADADLAAMLEACAEIAPLHTPHWQQLVAFNLVQKMPSLAAPSTADIAIWHSAPSFVKNFFGLYCYTGLLLNLGRFATNNPSLPIISALEHDQATQVDPQRFTIALVQFFSQPVSDWILPAIKMMGQIFLSQPNVTTIHAQIPQFIKYCQYLPFPATPNALPQVTTDRVWSDVLSPNSALVRRWFFRPTHPSHIITVDLPQDAITPDQQSVNALNFWQNLNPSLTWEQLGELFSKYTDCEARD